MSGYGTRMAARSAVLAVLASTLTGTAWAQGPAKAPDAPWIKVGTTIFTDFTYQQEPAVTSADKLEVRRSDFEVRRAYLNVTGAVSDLFSFRVTPDVASRQSTIVSGAGLPSDTRVGSNLDGSLTLRLKYAFAQVSFDKFGPRGKGAWVRLGQQQTPYIDFMEGIYRYRFQGSHFAERQGLLSSSDVGVSAHLDLPRAYGDLHAGLYNGETYSKAEANGQKAFQVRASVRPLPRRAVIKGLRFHGFYDRDAPVAGGTRDRVVGGATFEHRHLGAGADCIRATDRASGLPGAVSVRSGGCSVWVNPRLVRGLEALVRYDRYTPSRAVAARKAEVIAGLAYWFPVSKPPQAAALLVDYDGITYDALLHRPDERRWELKALLSF